jgi:hypothetical protein
MYLAPSGDAGAPDPFDRSGTWLLGDGDALKVVAVAPQGAAEKAGTHVPLRVTDGTGERNVELVLADAIPAHAVAAGR